MLYLNCETNFTVLQNRLELSAGNLKHHLTKLKEFGWIEVNVTFNPRVLQMVDITKAGKKEFTQYSEHLKRILDRI